MKEISKLDDKYIVIKTEDLEKYFSQYTRGIFTTEEEGKVIDRVPFNTVLEEIAKDREENGETPNNYVVLNLDDQIDLKYLRLQIQKTIENKIFDRHEGTKKIESKVSDVAIAFVNAILRVN